LLPIMMWLNILFSPYMSIVRSRRRFPRERRAACGPDSMTGRRSTEEQSEAQQRTIALRLRRGYTHRAILIKRPILSPCESGRREDPCEQLRGQFGTSKAT
jgi:hypothetical protein